MIWSNGLGQEEGIGFVGVGVHPKEGLSWPLISLNVSSPSLVALDTLFHEKLHFLLGLPSQFQGAASSSTGAV